MWWVAPDEDIDNYWEQILWYLYYSNEDINKAITTWPWQDQNGNSTWKGEYIITYNFPSK